MTIHITSALRFYTTQQSEVQIHGATLAEALAALDHRFPSIRFRIITEQDTIRPHIRIFVNDVQLQNLSAPLSKTDTVYIACALSGG